jgi:hypothetical protein
MKFNYCYLLAIQTNIMTILLFITWHKNIFIAGTVYQISQHSTPRQQCIGPVSALAVQLIPERGFSNSL